MVDGLKKDAKLFLRLPKEDTAKGRVLHAGIVLSIENNVCVIQLDEPCPGLDEATGAVLHFEEKQKFLQQSVRSVRKESEDPLVVVAELRGTAVSADQRQCFRVSCLGENIKATIGDESGCEVVDISATGFAFYGQREYEIGRRMRVTLVYNRMEFSGFATVQSVRRMNPKLLRFGMHCSGGDNDVFARSLASINVAVQAERRRRLARNS